MKSFAVLHMHRDRAEVGDKFGELKAHFSVIIDFSMNHTAILCD